MILRINNLHKTYHDRDLFKAASCLVRSGDKVAILGQNGSGKSTLLRIIMGLEKSDDAFPAYEWGQNVLVEYLAQEVRPIHSQQSMLEMTPIRQAEQQLKLISQELASDSNPDLLHRYNQVLNQFESLGGYSALDQINQHAQALGLDPAKLEVPISTLSGGELMRASMARILCSSADCLILDEPTNHLDADGIEWLENFLQNSNKTLIFVSHDRNLIDAVATKTISIEAGQLVEHPGNYSDYLRWSQAREHERKLLLTKAKTDFQKEREVAQTLLSHRNISGYHSRLKKADKLQAEISRLEALKPEQDRRLNFQLAAAEDDRRSDRVLILAKSIEVDYGSGPLFKAFDFVLRAGERVVFVGPNGCGKSSLLNGLSGQLEAFSGQLRYAKDLSLARLEQKISFRDESLSLLDEVLNRFPKIPESAARALLARFAFYDLEVFKQLSKLSGGERTRLNLLLILLEQPDVLILDEPTNHLDLNSKEVLENALSQYQGAIICVSHDRHFIAKLRARILGFKQASIQEFTSYNDYRLACHQAKIPTADSQSLELDSKQDCVLSSSKPNLAEPNSVSWTKQELELWPDLSSLPTDLDRPVKIRQFKAKAKLICQALMDRIEDLSDQAQTLENSFVAAKDEQVYKDYADLLDAEKALTTIYFKLSEQLEDLGS